MRKEVLVRIIRFDLKVIYICNKFIYAQRRISMHQLLRAHNSYTFAIIRFTRKRRIYTRKPPRAHKPYMYTKIRRTYENPLKGRKSHTNYAPRLLQPS